MWSTLLALLRSVCSALKSRRHLALENLALRQQLALLRKRSKRPQFGRVARIFMGLAFAALVGLARCLVLGSARDRHPLASAGVPHLLDRKSRRRGPGRPPVGSELRALIQKMSFGQPALGVANDNL